MKVTIECDSIEQAIDILRYTHAPGTTAEIKPVVVPPPNTAKVKGQRGRPPGRKTAAPVVQAAAIPETHTVPPKPIEQGTAQPTVADARTKLQELNAKKGMAACQKVMNALNVPRVSELKPAEIAAFISAVNAEINA